MVKLSNYMRQQQELIDERLDNLLASYQELHPALHEAMRYAVFSGGKRIRPLLVMAAAEAAGGAAPDALPAAVAVELLHTYTLIHDDLPAMDDDNLRRGQPTVHIKFGEANAILAGDALQALAFAALTKSSKANELTHELAEAGVRVVAGQWQDMAIETKPVGESDIEFIHEHKTANLLRASVRMGGIVAGATKKQLAALTNYGTAIGHIFQLIDDVLDAGTEDKPTAIAVYGMKGTKKRAAAYLEQAQSSLASVSSPEILRAIAELIFKRTA